MAPMRGRARYHRGEKDTHGQKGAQVAQGEQAWGTTCPWCGAACGAGARFCVRCGQPLGAAATGSAGATATGPSAGGDPQAPQAGGPAPTARGPRGALLVGALVIVAVLAVAGWLAWDALGAGDDAGTQATAQTDEAADADSTGSVTSVTYYDKDDADDEDLVTEVTVTADDEEDEDEDLLTLTDDDEDEEGSDGVVAGSTDSEYVLPDSDSRYLTRAEVEALSDEELRLARNEIYARHGRMFDSEDLQAYFDSKSWYVPLYTPEEYASIGYSLFNDFEIYNLELIIEVESER